MKNKVILNTIIIIIMWIISINLNFNTLFTRATFNNLIVSFIFVLCLMIYIYTLLINKKSNRIASFILNILKICLFIGIIVFILSYLVIKFSIEIDLFLMICILVNILFGIPFMGFDFITNNFFLVLPIIYLFICCVPCFFYKKSLRRNKDN